MPLTFKNAPLVELIAELRWEPPLSTATDQGGNQQQIPRSLLNTPEFEEFFQRFGGAIYQHGFSQMERLVPYGVPLPHDRIVCRYRHQDQSSYPVLAQVGPSIFSINALPPYKSWNDFRPWIEKAVSALIEAEPNLPKLNANVRYIDAFNEQFLNGRSASDFFDSELGFSIKLPKPILNRKSSDENIKTDISTTIPIDGKQMTIKLSEGNYGGEKAGIMDTLVSVSEPINPKKDEIISTLDNARYLIHESFIELTQNMLETLDPEGEDDF